jgi:hypothetical protein
MFGRLGCPTKILDVAPYRVSSPQRTNSRHLARSKTPRHHKCSFDGHIVRPIPLPPPPIPTPTNKSFGDSAADAVKILMKKTNTNKPRLGSVQTAHFCQTCSKYVLKYLPTYIHETLKYIIIVTYSLSPPPSAQFGLPLRQN